MGLEESFLYQIVVFRVPVLDERPLHGLFVGIRRHIDPVHGPGIQAGIVHDRGQGGGGGVEILDLLRVIAHVPDVLRQLHGFLHGGAGVAGH